MGDKQDKIMKTLELKHLATYLPYGLMMFSRYDKQTLCGTQRSLKHIGIDYAITIQAKPILLPLSELGKYPYNEKLHSMFVDDNEFNIDKLEMFVLGRWENNPIKWPYEVVSWLCENHFDVFGLIDAGLAVNKNQVVNPLN